jgi:hypothetical protein
MDAARVSQDARMRRLAEQPHTDVLEYTYETPIRDASAEMCLKLASRTVDARAKLPRALSVEQCAARVTREDTLLRDFAKTHPQTFLLFLDQEHCGRAMHMLQKMARVLQDRESGKVGHQEAEMRVNLMIQESCMRAPTAEEQARMSQ